MPTSLAPARPTLDGSADGRPIQRVAMLSVHGCPLDQLGSREVGGMQVYVRELSRELGRAGVMVDVFTRKTKGELARVVPLGPNARVVHLDAGPARRIDKNAVVEHLPAFIANVERFSEREGITHDVVHSHYWLSGWVGARLAELWNVPHVATFHTLGRVKNRANAAAHGRRGALESTMRSEIERRVIRVADAMIASTEHERTLIADEYGGRRDRIAVVPPGVDLTTFSPVDRTVARVALGLEGEVIAFVGRLDPVKGLDTLLQALRRLRDRPALTLLVIGGSASESAESDLDADEAYLRRLARDLGVADRVRWLGPIEQDRLHLYYSAADVVVVPSRYESFGLVALEALACGAPVVAARVGGLPSIVRDGANGLLIDTREPEDFAAAIARILDDPDLARRFSAAARPSIEHLAWTAMADRVRRLYTSLVEAPLQAACAGG